VTNQDPEFKIWLDKWTAQQLPSDVVARLIEEERLHAAAFMTEYGRFAAQFEAMYSAHVRLLDDVNFMEKSTWPTHRGIQYVLLAYNAKSIYSAFDRLMRGHYEDSITLLRSLYETFVRTMWVSTFPDVAYNVLTPKPVEGPAFNLTNYLRDNLRLEWQTNYNVLSTFTHSNSFLVLQAVIRAATREGEPERFQTRVQFDPKLAETAISFLIFVFLTHARFTVDLLVGSAPVPNNEHLATARNTTAALTRMVRGSPSAYWRRVAEDLDYLFEMLAVADRGEDWVSWIGRHRA
jgi:hypothetical protein